MIEVELKFRLKSDSYAAMPKKLLEVGMEEVSAVHQVDTIFLEARHHSFLTFVAGDPVVRVRMDDEKTILTAKRKLNDGGSIEEEVACNDHRKIQAVLGVLGFHAVVEVKKFRRTFVNDDVTVALDDVTHLGSFMEIEVLVDDIVQQADATARILSIAKSLAVPEEWIETRKYDAMMAEV